MSCNTIFFGFQIKEKVMGGASGTHGEEDKCVLEFGAKTYDGRATWKPHSLVWTIILKLKFKKQDGRA